MKSAVYGTAGRVWAWKPMAFLALALVLFTVGACDDPFEGA